MLKKIVAKHKKLVLLGLLTVWFFVLFLGLKQHSQSIYFQDETDHVAIGWMMDRFNQKLYTDLTTNHQPVPVLLGLGLVKLIKFNTLFQLIERLRLSMLIFHFLAAIFITLKFKWKGLLSVVLYSSLIYLYFGWYVLAEAIVAPGVAWIILELLSLTKKTKHPAKIEVSNIANQVSDLDNLFFHVLVTLLAFSLLPLWPFCALSLIYFWLHLKPAQRSIGAAIVFSLTAIMFAFISPLAWFRETIWHNYKYFLPYDTNLGLSEIPSLILLPLTDIKNLGSSAVRFLFAGTVFIISSLIYQFKLKNKANKKLEIHSWLKIIFLALILFSLNNRVTHSSDIFYRGFHLYPYIASFSSLLAYLGWTTFTQARHKGFKIGLVGFLLILVLSNLSWIRERKDKLNEYFINYGTFDAYARALKIISPPDATLMSGPNGAGYINIMSEIPLAGRQLFHLPWAYRSQFLRSKFQKMLATHPPTFVYFLEDQKNGFYQDLKPLLNTKYVEFKRSDGSQTQLWALTNSLDDVTEEEWWQFQQQEFQRID